MEAILACCLGWAVCIPIIIVLAVLSVAFPQTIKLIIQRPYPGGVAYDDVEDDLDFDLDDIHGE